MNVYDFILAHEQDDITRLLLKKHVGIVDIKWIVQQIEGRRIAKYKIPFLYPYKYIHYPDKVPLEQCSSQWTALYKAALVQGNTLIDCTGGFGIDTLFFAKNFEQVLYLEKNSQLLTVFEHNLSVLDIHNIKTYLVDCISFLMQDKQVYSWLYIDPARRDNTGKKIFLLSDCEPNILAYWKLLSQKAENILLKTSPLLDIKQVWREIPVTSTHVVAVKNEVKEVLYLVEKDKTPSDNIICADINGDKIEIFEGYFSHEKSSKVTYAHPKRYLYEPNRSILKAGFFNSVAERYSLLKIAENSHLYTSDHYVDSFMGRIFEVIQVVPYQKKAFQVLNMSAFNIIARNFCDSPEQIAKKLSIRTGGIDNYLIATQNKDSQNILIVAKRMN